VHCGFDQISWLEVGKPAEIARALGDVARCNNACNLTAFMLAK
jgi:hypothetical protein